MPESARATTVNGSGWIENTARSSVGTLFGEFVRAVVGMILPVGLRNPHIQFAGADGIEVIDRTACRLDGAADAVLLAPLLTRRQIAPWSGNRHR